MKHRLSTLAKSDLREIWSYITEESQNPDIADNFVDLLISAIETIAGSPLIGRRRDNDLRPNIRSFPVKPYVIFYRIDEAGLFVLRVLHGRRNLKTLF